MSEDRNSGKATRECGAAAALIELEGIERTFESDVGAVRALDGVSLAVRAGEFVCIVGPSGSGKSTLLNILGCLDRPTRGRYLFGGRDVGELDDAERARLRREEVGFVFQNYALLDSLTAQRNVELPAVYAGVGRTERAARTRELLGTFGLGDRMDHLPAELSGGEQQRVAIARALMNGGRVVLADEPTGALGVRQGTEILSLLRRLADDGLAVVVVSHDPAVAARTRRRIEIEDGAVVKDSSDGSLGERRPAPRRAAAPEARLGRSAEVLRSTFRNLRMHGWRTVSMAATSALGTACAIALIALADGTYRESTTVMGSLGADRIGVTSPLSRLGIDDIHALGRLANVNRVLGMQFGQATVRYADRHVADAPGTASDEPPEYMWAPWPLAGGVHIDPADSEDMSQVAVLSPKLRELLFPADVDPVGERIEVGGVPFEVKGVLAPHPIMQNEGHRSRGYEPLPQLFVPLMPGRELLLGPQRPLQAHVYVDDAAGIERTAADIRDLLIRRHGQAVALGFSSATPNAAFLVSMGQAIVRPYRDAVNRRVSVLGGVAVAALIAAALATMAFMWNNVRQRRDEIAIRMAVGARRRDIFGQFLVEAGAIMAIGTACGVPLGVLLARAAALVVDVVAAFDPWFVAAAVSAALATGIAAGIGPAHRASRLSPATALARE